MFLYFIRIIKFSLQDIGRNIWLSLVTIIILVLALFTVNMLLVVKVIGDTAVNAIKEKIDVEYEADRIVAISDAEMNAWINEAFGNDLPPLR